MTDRAALLHPGDDRLPSREECVLEPVLRSRAVATPDAVFAIFEDGSTWSYANTLDKVESTAAALQALGVRPGDRVLTWLPNGQDALRCWFGANFAGAANVPVNIAHRGAVLEHVVWNSGAKVVVTRPQLAERLLEVAAGSIDTVVLLPSSRAETVPLDSLRSWGVRVIVGAEGEGFRSPEQPLQPWDTQTVIYTSGTTGLSKGVLSSYAHLYTSAVAAFYGRVSSVDRYLVQLPLFHAGGTIGVYAMLLHGAGVVVVPSFRTGTFWSVVRDFSVTHCTLIGVMATYLLKEPRRDGDRDHSLREAFVIPVADGVGEFRERFGVRMHALFNMTEVSCPIMAVDPPDIAMYAGTARPGITARLVDEADRPVPPGEIGELVLRADRPWSFSHGYHENPQATAEAWRNGWFHTGDSFRLLDEGGYVFVDRLKDAIRRRGENVSSYEVEREALTHPSLREAAAVAVPGDEGEDDILLIVSPVHGLRVDPEEICRHLRDRVAHFMVPRFIRVVDALPLTSTGKPMKARLRATGLTDNTWDRTATSMQVRAERIS